MDTEPQLIIFITSEYPLRLLGISLPLCLGSWWISNQLSAPPSPSLLKSTLLSKSLLECCPNSLLMACPCPQEASQWPPSLTALYMWSGMPWPPSVNGLLTGDTCQRWPARQSLPPSEIYIGAPSSNSNHALSQTLFLLGAEFLDTISLQRIFKTFVVFLKLFLHRKSAWFSVNSTSDLTCFNFFVILIRNHFKLYSLPGWYKNSLTFSFFFLTF